MKFPKPDGKTIKRMTVQSVSAIIETLESQRDQVVAPFDEQLKFYKKILEDKKREAESAKTAS